MKKDDEIQTMIDELYLLKRHELPIGRSFSVWLKRHHLDEERELEIHRAGTMKVLFLHARFIKGKAVEPSPKRSKEDAYKLNGNIRQGLHHTRHARH